MTSNLAHEGHYIITKKYIDGTIKTDIKNAITTLAINKYARVLLGDAPNLEVKYLAIGSGNKAIDNADTTLQTEIFRTFYTGRSETAPNEVTIEFAVLDTEAIGQWEELGIFCGTGATATANTGIMLSRVLFSDIKTGLEEINILYVSRILRA